MIFKDSFDNDQTDIVLIVIDAMLFSILSLSPMIICWFLNYMYSRLKLDYFKMRYGTLYQSLKTDKISYYIYSVLFLARRL